MAWQTPKTDWLAGDGVADIDMNRIEGNTLELKTAVATANVVRTVRKIVGTSTAGWTARDCDYLCDGEDDNVEIQQAIDSLSATGGEIVLLDGTYAISNSVSLRYANIILSGNGTATKLQSGSTAGTVVNISAANCVLRTLLIRTTTDTTALRYGVNIPATGVNALIQNVTIYSGYVGVANYASATLRFCTIICSATDFPSTPTGCYGIDSRTTITVHNCSITSSEYALQLRGYFDIQNNTITVDAVKAYQYYLLDAMTGDPTFTCIICNNRCIKQGTTSSALINVTMPSTSANSNVLVLGNELISNGAAAGISLNLRSTPAIVADNIIRNASVGIKFTQLDVAPAAASITGNVCINCATGLWLSGRGAAYSFFCVTGNTCMKGTGTASEYTEYTYTINVSSAAGLVTSNLVPGKNVVVASGMLAANNKY